MEKVALFTAVAQPTIAKMGIGIHFVCTGVLGAVAAVKERDVKALVKFVALAVLSYGANTPKYTNLLIEHIYSKMRDDMAAIFNFYLSVPIGILAATHAGRFGLSTEKVALLTILTLPGVGKGMICSRFAIIGLRNGIAAGKALDGKAFAKFAALMTFACLGLSGTFQTTLEKHIYSRL